MKIDITTKQDLKQLVYAFYDKVILNEEIGHFFTQVVKLDLQAHLPIMVDFWESILLGGKSYKGNPMVKHIDLNKKSPLKQKHFDQWIKLWTETVNELFEGKKAAEAINRAQSIASLMHYNIASKT